MNKLIMKEDECNFYKLIMMRSYYFSYLSKDKQKSKINY